jgi:ankyrin repeat protein
MMEEDLYLLLGVSTSATIEEIDKAYAEKERAFNQKAGSLDLETQEKIRALRMAHEILRNSATRKAYDKMALKLRESNKQKQPSAKPAHPDVPSQSKAGNDTSSSRPSPKQNGLVALLRGDRSPLRTILLCLVIPFISGIFLFAGSSVAPKAVYALWFVVAGFILFRSARNSASKFARIATKSLAVLVVAFHSLLLVGLLIPRQNPSLAGTTAAGDADPGCVDVANAVLALVEGSSKQVNAKDAEFLNTPSGQFLEAARKGSAEDVSRLLGKGVDMYVPDQRSRYYGNTALHHAARANSIDVAKVLLESGMKVDVPGPTGYSPLHVAAGLGQQRIAAFLIEHGADVKAFDKGTQTTPLEIAAVQGRAKTVGLILLRSAGRLGSAESTAALRSLTRAGTICPSHAGVVERLIQAGADLRSVEGRSAPLFVSIASRGDLLASIVAALVDTSAWTTPFETSGWQAPVTPIFHLICSGTATESVKSLISKSPNKAQIKAAATGPWGSPLHCLGSSASNLSMIQFLFEQGFDVTARDSKGKTPLHLNPAPEIVREFVAKGADINAVDNEGKTPLHYSVSTWDKHVEAMLAAGSDVNAADKFGRAPIFYAHNPQILDLLVSHGAKINVRDNDGRSPLTYQLSRNESQPSPDQVQFFLRNGVESGATDATGATACHFAARQDPSVLKVLIANGTKCFGARDLSGRTPLHYAVARYVDGSATLIVQNGGSLDTQDADGNTPMHLAAQSGSDRFIHEAARFPHKSGIRNRTGLRARDLVPEGKPWTDALVELLG